jgi:5-methyltetrahydropteroyltriglutamate--homocysteine methyltransferase
LIRSANHSSFPKVGESPLDQEVRLVLKRHEAGKATDDEVSQVIDEVITIVVAQQSRAFIDIVTDGMVRWSGPLSQLAGNLSGLELRGLRRWFATNSYDRRVAVVAPIRRPGAFLLHDLEVARSVAQKPVKVTLPGPATFARLCVDEHYGSRDAVAEALAEVLAEEVLELVRSGATCFQLDEPLLCRYPEDLDLVVRTARVVFDAAGPEATTVLSSYFGDLLASVDALDKLPGSHLGFEVAPGHPNLGLLDRLPDGMGVSLGVFDARTTVQEDAEDVARLLEPYRDVLTSRDVLVGPSAGLELLPRDQAFDKLLHARYLVEKLSREWTWAS